jgi:uncharacterized membrane protein
LLNPEDWGFVISMPLGGLHLFVSLIVNFGWLGAAFFCAAIGAAVAALHNRSGTWLGTIIYCAVSGWLGFSLFRDPMSVSIVKNIVQVSLLWPLLVVLALNVLAYAASQARARLEQADPQRSALQAAETREVRK